MRPSRGWTLAVLCAGAGANAALCAAPLPFVRGGPASLAQWPVVSVLLLLSGWAAAEAAAQPRGVAGACPARGPEALPLAMLGVVWVSLTQRALAGSSMHWAVEVLGLVTAALGIALRLAALRALGERFLDGIELLPVHRLEQRGVYRVLRHPAETGNVLIAVGCAVAAGSVWGVLMSMGVVAPLSAWRVLREEALLRPLRARARA
jgi:protein-S-isoprenylcysteine O-methyltransferase Ste14